LQDADLSIYEIENNLRIKRHGDTGAARSTKSTLGSYCSYASNSGSSRYHQSGEEDGGGDDAYDKRRNKLSLYRRNAGGGGSFLINDFLCRDLLIVLKDLLGAYTSSAVSAEHVIPSNTFVCSITTSGELVARSSKLVQLVGETMWRFQLIRNEAIKIEYGQITAMGGAETVSSGAETARTGPEEKLSVAAESELEQNVVYEMMKTNRKRASSSASLYSSLNESFKNVSAFVLYNKQNYTKSKWDVAKTILFFSHNLESAFLSYGIQFNWNSFNYYFVIL
jgi:hypothetical protein